LTPLSMKAAQQHQWQTQHLQQNDSLFFVGV